MSASALAPGTVLSHSYRIEAPLKQHGAGGIYRARHIELGTAHVIRLIPPAFASKPDLLDLLVTEVRKLSAIRHDAIVNYEGLLRDEREIRFLVTEFVEGETLQEMLARRRLEPNEVLRLRDRLAGGLAAVHSRGIVHGNVAPEHIVLPDGDIDRAKLTDFGIAHSMDPADATLLGFDALAKHGFASPEQFGLEGGRVDARSDIYSLGLVLAAAAVGFGKTLDMGSTTAAMIAARQRRPDLSSVPRALRSVIAPMLAPRLDDRPPSMQALIEADRTTSPSPRRMSHWWLPIAACGIAAVVALAVGLALWRFLAPPPSKEELSTRLATATSGYQCASLTFALAPDRSARIQGHVASAADLDRLRNVVTSISGLGAATLDVGIVGAPHCELVDMLAPLAGAAGAGPHIGFTGSSEPRIGDRLSLDVQVPKFDAYVYVDYFDRGGQVLHLFPNSRDFFNFRPARNHFVVFKPPLTSCWVFNGSTGQELISLIATAKPLFKSSRPEIESISDYVTILSPFIRASHDNEVSAATLLFNLGEPQPGSGGATACPPG